MPRCIRTQQYVYITGDPTASVDENIKSLPPLLTRTVKRSFGVLHHVLGHGLSRHYVGMDTVVLASDGKLSAFEPSGRFLWKVRIKIGFEKRE